MGDVEVDELGLVVIAITEGDRETNLTYRGGGAVSHSLERLGGLKLIIWYLKAVECLDGLDIEPCATVDEGLGDLHVADDGCTKH